MLRLTVPAVVGSLEPVNAFVRTLAREAGLPPRRAYRLRLATEELLVNIVSHGYGPDRPDAQVVLEGDVGEDRVWIQLIDTAAPFNPVRAPNPTGLDRPLQERDAGSLGLYLARHAVDATYYEYVEGSNRTTIVMRRVQGDNNEQCDDARDDTDRQRLQRDGARPVADPHRRRGTGADAHTRRRAGTLDGH